MSRGPS